MTALQQIRLFTGGWGDILFGRPSWREKFELTTSGVAVAVVVFLVTVGMRVADGLAVVGTPDLATLVQAMLINLMPLFGLILGTLLTYVSLRIERPMLDVLVPGVYALALTLMLGTLLVFFGLIVGPLVLALLAVMLARAARVAGGLGIGVSIAYAALVVVLLVVLNEGLYMLVASSPQPVSGI